MHQRTIYRAFLGFRGAGVGLGLPIVRVACSVKISVFNTRLDGVEREGRGGDGGQAYLGIQNGMIILEPRYGLLRGRLHTRERVERDEDGSVCRS